MSLTFEIKRLRLLTRTSLVRRKLSQLRTNSRSDSSAILDSLFLGLACGRKFPQSRTDIVILAIVLEDEGFVWL